MRRVYPWPLEISFQRVVPLFDDTPLNEIQAGREVVLEQEGKHKGPLENVFAVKATLKGSDTPFWCKVEGRAHITTGPLTWQAFKDNVTISIYALARGQVLVWNMLCTM